MGDLASAVVAPPAEGARGTPAGSPRSQVPEAIQPDPATVPVGEVSPTEPTPSSSTGGSGAAPDIPTAEAGYGGPAPAEGALPPAPPGPGPAENAGAPEIPVPVPAVALLAGEQVLTVRELAARPEARPATGSESWRCVLRSNAGSDYPPLGIYFGDWADLRVPRNRFGGYHHAGTLTDVYDRWETKFPGTPAPVYFRGRAPTPFLVFGR